MQRAKDPLPFTPVHRLELRNALRLRVFRGEITAEQRRLAFQEIEADLDAAVLMHTPIPWTDAFRASEDLGAAHTEKRGVRSIDLLHLGIALAWKATEFLTFDNRQAELAKAAGLRVKP